MKPVRVLQLGLMAGCALMLSGCANQSPSLRGSLQSAARAIALGRAADNFDSAVRGQDEAALLAAAQELERSRNGAATRSGAEMLVGQASQLEAQSQKLKGTSRDQKREQAAKLYRQALQLDPQFNSSDATLLNALGYFLAERGTTPQDWQHAERLTRRAVAILDRNINDPSLRSLFGPQDKLTRAITRDSVAWALFRQGRFEAARREQEAALQEYKAIQGDQLDPELLFHLGEIYRALKRPQDARRQYEAALKIQPDHEMSRRALTQLR